MLPLTLAKTPSVSKLLPHIDQPRVHEKEDTRPEHIYVQTAFLRIEHQPHQQKVHTGQDSTLYERPAHGRWPQASLRQFPGIPCRPPCFFLSHDPPHSRRPVSYT